MEFTHILKHSYLALLLDQVVKLEDNRELVQDQALKHKDSREL